MLDTIKNISTKKLNKILYSSYAVNILFGFLFPAFFWCDNCGESLLQGVPFFALVIAVILQVISVITILVKVTQLTLNNRHSWVFVEIVIFSTFSLFAFGLVFSYLAIFAFPVYVIASLLIVLISFVHYLKNKISKK